MDCVLAGAEAHRGRPLNEIVRSHVPLADDELANELRAFAKRFAASCNFEQAAEMLKTDHYSIEYHNEPTDDRYFEVAASPLERDSDEDGEYVLFSICANDLRPKAQLGSTWRPMCCLAYIYASGKIEFGVIGNSAASEEIRDF